MNLYRRSSVVSKSSGALESYSISAYKNHAIPGIVTEKNAIVEGKKHIIIIVVIMSLTYVSALTSLQRKSFSQVNHDRR